MANQRSFGRRATSLPQPGRTNASLSPIPDAKAVTPILVTQPASLSPQVQALSVDDELQEWKRARKGFRIPWRPLSLMASLCFGIASFVLPDSVNDAVDWVLYVLAAASFLAGISARREAKNRR